MNFPHSFIIILFVQGNILCHNPYEELKSLVTDKFQKLIEKYDVLEAKVDDYVAKNGILEKKVEDMVTDKTKKISVGPLTCFPLEDENKAENNMKNHLEQLEGKVADINV